MLYLLYTEIKRKEINKKIKDIVVKTNTIDKIIDNKKEKTVINIASFLDIDPILNGLLDT